MSNAEIHRACSNVMEWCIANNEAELFYLIGEYSIDIRRKVKVSVGEFEKTDDFNQRYLTFEGKPHTLTIDFNN